MNENNPLIEAVLTIINLLVVAGVLFGTLTFLFDFARVNERKYCLW